MRIRRVEFRNFRSLTSFDLDLDGSSVFVIGENAGGKTSLLTGIARALGRDLSFTSADFANLQEPIELRVTLTDLDAAQRGVFGNYVQFGAGAPTLQLEARAVWDAVTQEADVEHGYPRQPGSRTRREERDAIPLQWLPSGRDPARMLQFGVVRNLVGKLLEGLPIQESLDNAVGEVRRASQEFGRRGYAASGGSRLSPAGSPHWQDHRRRFWHGSRDAAAGRVGLIVGARRRVLVTRSWCGCSRRCIEKLREV